MKIAIPTYKRAILIRQLTLGYLNRCGIRDEEIDLFVSGPDQAEQYRSVCDCNVIVTPAENVRDKFNCIHSYYASGEEVVVMEDDLKCVKRLTGYNQLTESLDVMDHAAFAFQACESEGTKVWGINSNSNPFFMKSTHSIGFKFVVANMYGFIAEEDNSLLITQHSKTDYERTILYFKKYGRVVRLDYLCPVTNNYTTPGGMQDLIKQRAAMEEESVNYLTTTYPELCQRNTKKNSVYPEMLLKLRKGATPAHDFL
jgi:hypothetical protein